MEENLPKNNWVLPTLAFGFILLVSFLFISGKEPLNSQSKTAAPIATPTPEKRNVTLSTSPEKLDLKVGAKTTIPINIESPDAVSAVEMHLTFDPKIITIRDITPMEFFDNPKILKKEINNEKGEIVFILGSLLARSGSGQLAQIALSAKAVGKTNLEFSPTSQAATSGNSQNALGETTGALITVLGK